MAKGFYKYTKPTIGGLGPVRLRGRAHQKTRRLVDTKRGVRAVFVTRLTTSEQVSLATAIWHKLGFPEKKGKYKIAARPFMEPALRKSMPMLASFWKDAIR